MRVIERGFRREGVVSGMRVTSVLIFVTLTLDPVVRTLYPGAHDGWEIRVTRVPRWSQAPSYRPAGLSGRANSWVGYTMIAWDGIRTKARGFVGRIESMRWLHTPKL